MMTISFAGQSTGMGDVDAVASLAVASTVMGDVDAVAAIIVSSPRSVRRRSDCGDMPRPVHIGRLVRWRLRTGDPKTGVLDWIEAGCPSCRPSTKARAT